MPTIIVNGSAIELGDNLGGKLLGYLRNDLGLYGSKPGCGEGQCGACTVLIDKAPSLACQISLSEAAGHSVITIEGLAERGKLNPVQEALIEEQASQCGYCTPGITLRATALLASNTAPNDQQIAEALDQNVCRCGCYPRIVQAVHRASRILAEGSRVGIPEELPIAKTIDKRPQTPWDLTDPEKREWFEILGDGLVVVWPPMSVSHDWPRTGGAWLHVSLDDVVTAFSGKVDVGQDNLTAFRLLVAEELCMPPHKVELVMGDTDLCPYDIGTFGSRSMPDTGEALRRAAAGAREHLVSVAARQWKVDPADLKGYQGSVIGGPMESSLSYPALVSNGNELLILAEEPKLLSPQNWRLLGRRHHFAPRRDAVTGTRRYASDLDRPGMLHGALLRPPSSESRLLDIDVTGANAVPGVQIVQDREFIGATAKDPVSARRAIASLRATWDEPAVTLENVESHLRSHPIAGRGWERPLDHAEGDVERALEVAAARVDASYTTAYIAHVPLETRAAVAEWDPGRI